MDAPTFISVDLQNDFAGEGGKHYVPRQSVIFLKKEFFPYLKSRGIKVNEIISDYRQPRLGELRPRYVGPQINHSA